MKAKKPMSPWTMPLVSVAILLLTGAVLVALWLWVSRQTWTDPEKRTLAQLDVVKVASGIALGGGGLFTLYLAARRQRTQEQAQADTNADNEARRITELYTKAVQELGDSKPPVRLGGLYALELLGQQQPGQRQTIVNVLCAYLRMPYTPPPERTGPPANRVHRPLLRSSRRTGIRQSTSPSGSPALLEARQELDVRLTAQNILIAHLKDDSPDYWGVCEIDLSGAVLIDFEMIRTRLGVARFNGTSFRGNTCFEATFTDYCAFIGASFVDDVNFSESSFQMLTRFTHASFSGAAVFASTSFGGYVASFNKASFAAGVNFNEATFDSIMAFSSTTFGGEAAFDKAWVHMCGKELSSTWPDGWKLGTGPVPRPGHDGEWFQLVRTSSAAPLRPPTPGS